MSEKKSDADMLSELSCMPSVAPRERKSTLNETSKKPPVASRFKNENEMNDYIQKCINDALKKSGNEKKEDKPVSSTIKNEVMSEYNNPRKESSTGKHAGVNSFIRNLGTIGYGEERKDMVNHNAHANIKSSTKMAQNKGESKIAENILQKLNEREAKDKAKKKYPQSSKSSDEKKPKYKSSSKKPKQEEPEMLTEERKSYPFTRINSIHNKNNGTSQQQQFFNPLQQFANPQQQFAPNQQQFANPQQQFANPQQQFANPQQQFASPQRQFAPPQRQSKFSLHQSRPQQFQQISSQHPPQRFSQNQNQLPHNQFSLPNPQQSQQMNSRRQQPAQPQQIQPSQQPQQPQQLQNNNEIQNSFVFIMPSYNGAKWIKRIFDSIKSQSYQNYRIIYVNDCSDDNTIPELNAYTKLNPHMNIMLINNMQRQWPAYSRYVACKEVYDHEICVFLDGDDWLVDDDCLKTLNTVFQNPNIYATFGSMENAPWQFKKWKKYNRANINDGEGAYFPHLRTTRASIAKLIPPYYMQTETGDWLHVCTDVALFMAVIEAVGHDGYVFLKNAFVHYNTSNHNKNTKEGYTNSKGSDMRIYYRSTIRDKVPMKKITRPIAYSPQQQIQMPPQQMQMPQQQMQMPRQQMAQPQMINRSHNYNPGPQRRMGSRYR